MLRPIRRASNRRRRCAPTLGGVTTLYTCNPHHKVFRWRQKTIDGAEHGAVFYVVNRAVIDIDLIIISGIHERIAAFTHPGADERVNDQKLGYAFQIDRPVFPQAIMAFMVGCKCP